MLVFGPHVVAWVAEANGNTYLPGAVGIGYERNGRIVQGVVFTDYSGANIQGHIACSPGHSFYPTFIAAIFDYPFNQVKVRRITVFVASRNERSRSLVTHLGAVYEGVLTDALDDDDLIVYGLLRRNAQQWLTARFSNKLKQYRR